jgi:hypothetical protein
MSLLIGQFPNGPQYSLFDGVVFSIGFGNEVRFVYGVFISGRFVTKMHNVAPFHIMDYIIPYKIAYVKAIMIFFHGLQKYNYQFDNVNNINKLSNILAFFFPEKGLKSNNSQQRYRPLF